MLAAPLQMPELVNPMDEMSFGPNVLLREVSALNNLRAPDEVRHDLGTWRFHYKL